MGEWVLPKSTDHGDGLPILMEVLATQIQSHAFPTRIAIGLEGGLAMPKRADATARWQCVALGPRILRVETAAVALVAISPPPTRSAPA